MTWFTFGTVSVYNPSPGADDKLVAGATGGKLVAVKDGPAIPIRDLNGTPITEITSNSDGQSLQFQAEVRSGLIQFGDLVVTVWANEVAENLDDFDEAISTAQSAVTAAQQAVVAAQAALAAAQAGGGGGGVTDHGALSGLDDDDHPQYLNIGRGDARYYTQPLVNQAIANAVGAASTADRNRANHSGTQLSSTISDFTAAVQAVAGSGSGGGSYDWSAITNKPTTFPPSSHTHIASELSDSTTVGRALVKATDAATARAAIGAGTGNGTSNLALGSTSTTAAPGNHAHAASAITFTPSGSLTATDVQAAIVQAAASSGGGGTSGFDFTAAAQGGSIDNADRIDAQIDLANAVGGTVVLGPGSHRTTRPFKTLTSARVILDHGAVIVPASGYSGAYVGSAQDAVANGSTTVNSPGGNFPAGIVGLRVHGINVPLGTTVVTRTNANSIILSNAVPAPVDGGPLGLAFGAGLFTMSGKGCEVSGTGTIRGGAASSTVSSSNPLMGAAILLVNGASFAKVDGLTFTAVNGWNVLAETWVAGGLYDGKFTRLGGNFNGKGIRIAGNADNRDGQVFLDQINFQVVDQGHGIDLDGINDVQIGTYGACVSGAVAGTYGLRIAGDGSSVTVDNYDAGSFPAVPGAAGSGIIIGDGGTPNNVSIGHGVTQGANPGVLVTGGFNVRLALKQYSRSAGPGVKVTGGDNIDIVDGTFTRNGKTETTACEIEVTSTTARVRIARNRFTTPIGTATEQVANVFKLPSVNRVTVADDNAYTGGHTAEDLYASGIRGLPIVTRNVRTSSYTLTGLDANNVVEMNMSAANTVTIPAGVFTSGDAIVIRQYGPGVTTNVAGSGLTLRSRGGVLSSAGQYAEWTVSFRSATEAVISGDLA